MTDKTKLAALLHMCSKQEFHILEVEAIAKDTGNFKTMTFEIVGPKGKLSCQFEDAYYGRFRDEQGRVFMVRDFIYISDTHCENLGVANAG